MDDFQTRHLTGEGFRTLTIYRLFFKRALADVLAHRAAYDAEVRDWYENGDGRSPEWVRYGDLPDAYCDGPADAERQVNIGGQGHTFPHCIHGASRWTDYDNICGGCEDSLSAIEEARGIARDRFLTFLERWEWFLDAPSDLDPKVRNDLSRWAFSLFPKD